VPRPGRTGGCGCCISLLPERHKVPVPGATKCPWITQSFPRAGRFYAPPPAARFVSASRLRSSRKRRERCIILKWLAEHRFLRTSHITALLALDGYSAQQTMWLQPSSVAIRFTPQPSRFSRSIAATSSGAFISSPRSHPGRGH
jgi:hypothetical protein